jgi:hypothetical protein
MSWYNEQILTIFIGNNSIGIWNTNVRPDGGFLEICGTAEVVDPELQGEFLVEYKSVLILKTRIYLHIGMDDIEELKHRRKKVKSYLNKN